MAPIENDGVFVANDTPIKMGVNPHLTFADRNGTVIILTDGSPQPRVNYEQAPKKESEITMKKTEFYISMGGVALTAIIAACSSVWLISNHVSNSVGDARKELQSAINSSRQEVVSVITTIDNRNNDRFNRIENQFDKIDSKVDGNFRDTSKSLAEIKELISNKK